MIFKDFSKCPLLNIKLTIIIKNKENVPLKEKQAKNTIFNHTHKNLKNNKANIFLTTK